MDTDAYYTYVHETLDRGNLEEIFDLYRLNSLSKDGLIVLTLIDKVTPVLSRRYKYPKFRRFKDLIIHHMDVTSPLHKMHVSNGFVLVPENDRIPFEKKEFFRLLRRTPSIKGIRIIFGAKSEHRTVVLDSYSEKPDLAFCAVKEGKDFDLTTYGSRYYRNLDEYRPTRLALLKMSDSEKTRLSYSEILEDERIDGWFNPNSILTDRMVSNDIEIFTNFGEKLSNADFLLESCDNKKEGLVFNGVDENGEYIFNIRGGTKVVPFYYVSGGSTSLTMSFYEYINANKILIERRRIRPEYLQTLPVIPKNIPRDARKSILLYYIQGIVFPKDLDENFGLATDKVRRYSEKGICYDSPIEEISYLTINEELQEGEVITFLDDSSYRVSEKVFSKDEVNTYSILEL